jgi:hypothetical protein
MVSVKGIATLVLGMVVGGVIVSNSTLIQGKPAVTPAEEVVTGHRVSPLGQEMLTYKGARTQIVAL